jgi:hypothetical protein
MSETTDPIDVVLRDGSTVRIRPVEAGDVMAMEAFLPGQP